MSRILSFIDRRLLLYIAAACFGAAFLLAVVNTAADNRSSHRQNDQLIVRTDKLIEQGEVERAVASRERQRLLDSIDDLDAKYQALLAYFRAQGYTIPEYVLRGQSSSDNDDDDGDTDITIRTDRAGSTPAPEPPKQVTPPPANDGGDRPGRSESGGSRDRGSQGAGHRPS